MKLSILTATYNRAEYLKRIYESILENKLKSIIEVEWIIIDDGSTDDTNEVINEIIKKDKKKLNNERSEIIIKKIYQKNQGKMAAINRGMKEVTGELVVDCDSDDFFAKNAFKVIEKNVNKLLKNNKLYALCFLKQDKNGNISGNKFNNNNQKSTMFDLYFKEDVKGEKILVFNSEIRKKFKHELENKENFITEARMYHKMDKVYKILCINEVIEIGEYVNDGYTKNIKDIFIKNPKGYYKYFKEILKTGLMGVTLRKKIYIIKNFIYFWILNMKIEH